MIPNKHHGRKAREYHRRQFVNVSRFYTPTGDWHEIGRQADFYKSNIYRRLIYNIRLTTR